VLQGDCVEKYVKLLRVTSIKAVKCILPLLFDSPSYFLHFDLLPYEIQKCLKADLSFIRRPDFTLAQPVTILMLTRKITVYESHAVNQIFLVLLTSSGLSMK